VKQGALSDGLPHCQLEAELKTQMLLKLTGPKIFKKNIPWYDLNTLDVTGHRFKTYDDVMFQRPFRLQCTNTFKVILRQPIGAFDFNGYDVIQNKIHFVTIF